MVLFFRLTRRKRLKKRSSLRFCRRHEYASWFSLDKKQSAEHVGVVLVACVIVRACEREKEVFFCVFFFLFVCFCSCLLLLIFSSVVCLCKNEKKLKQNYFIAQFLLLAKIESLYLLLAFIKLVSKKSRERETRETRERVFCCCCCCCCCCC